MQPPPNRCQFDSIGVPVLSWHMGSLANPKTPKLGTSWASISVLSKQHEICQVERRKNKSKSDTTHQQKKVSFLSSSVSKGKFKPRNGSIFFPPLGCQSLGWTGHGPPKKLLRYSSSNWNDKPKRWLLVLWWILTDHNSSRIPLVVSLKTTIPWDMSFTDLERAWKFRHFGDDSPKPNHGSSEVTRWGHTVRSSNLHPEKPKQFVFAWVWGDCFVAMGSLDLSICSTNGIQMKENCSCRQGRSPDAKNERIVGPIWWIVHHFLEKDQYFVDFNASIIQMFPQFAVSLLGTVYTWYVRYLILGDCSNLCPEYWTPN